MTISGAEKISRSGIHAGAYLQSDLVGLRRRKLKILPHDERNDPLGGVFVDLQSAHGASESVTARVLYTL